MEKLSKKEWFLHNPDALYYVRKLYDLEKPGRMKEAIDILEEWIKKQEHFVSKTFDRNYLEILIIACKGSLEKAKFKLDKMCTLRTMVPEFFAESELMELKLGRKLGEVGVLPRMTPEYHRIFIFKGYPGPYGPDDCLNYFRDLIVGFEYLTRHDYNAGVIAVIDFFGTNMKDLLITIKWNLVQSFMITLIEGFGMKMKGFHFLSNSKLIETFIPLVKAVVSAKISRRIYVHDSVESLQKVIPRELLPEDMGGEQLSMTELDAIRINYVTNKEHIEYMKEMNQKKTDESKRIRGKTDLEYLHGTFRNLNVD